MLEKRALGTTGISVNPIGIGLWAMGGKSWGPTDDAESLQVLERALDMGIDFFDTADVYGDGHSEELLGRSMKGRRSRFIVGTKIGWQQFDRKNNASAYTTPEKVIAGVETNLKRLQTDYIDVLQWHVDFREPTMEAVIAGCQRLKQKGKIRAYGLSASDAAYIKEFSSQDAETLQIDYSILNRTPEKEVFPYCRERRIGTIIRGGLAMGLLTGKFTSSASFDPSDFRSKWITDERQHAQFLEDLRTVDRLKEAFPGYSLAQLALLFILGNPDVAVVIPGAKRVSQLEANFHTAELEPLSGEQMRQIDAIVVPGGGRKIWPA